MKASDFLKSLNNISLEDLYSIDGVGEVLCLNMADFTSSNRYSQLINEFQKLEGSDISIEIITEQTKLTPKFGKYVITGTFNISRNIIIGSMEKQGYQVCGAVSSDIIFCLAGKNPGSKILKAKELNIKIITDLKEFGL